MARTHTDETQAPGATAARPTRDQLAEARAAMARDCFGAVLLAEIDALAGRLGMALQNAARAESLAAECVTHVHDSEAKRVQQNAENIEHCRAKQRQHDSEIAAFREENARLSAVVRALSSIDVAAQVQS